MEHNVAIRMGKNASIVGNTDAAEPEVVAVSEGVDIEPRSHPRHHAHTACPQPQLGCLEIGGAREFDVGGIALEYRHSEACPLRQSAVVGEAVEAGFRRPAVR